jgi:hypothetical protein
MYVCLHNGRGYSLLRACSWAFASISVNLNSSSQAITTHHIEMGKTRALGPGLRRTIQPALLLGSLRRRHTHSCEKFHGRCLELPQLASGFRAKIAGVRQKSSHEPSGRIPGTWSWEKPCTMAERPQFRTGFAKRVVSESMSASSVLVDMYASSESPGWPRYLGGGIGSLGPVRGVGIPFQLSFHYTRFHIISPRRGPPSGGCNKPTQTDRRS